MKKVFTVFTFIFICINAYPQNFWRKSRESHPIVIPMPPTPPPDRDNITNTNRENVGIGICIPEAKLHVSDKVIISKQVISLPIPIGVPHKEVAQAEAILQLSALNSLTLPTISLPGNYDFPDYWVKNN